MPATHHSLIPSHERARKRDIFVVMLINFLASVAFSIVLPSLWPYIKLLGGAKVLTGYAIAVNSLGTFLSSPPLGWLADRRSLRESLVLALLFGIVGSVLYSMSEVSDHNVNRHQHGCCWEMLLAARFLVGMSSGSGAVAFTYLNYATPEPQRPLVYSLFGASTVLGFIVGPAFSLIGTVPFLQGRLRIHGQYSWYSNAVTMPGWISAVLFSLCALLCLTVFREVKKPVAYRCGRGSLCFLLFLLECIACSFLLLLSYRLAYRSSLIASLPSLASRAQ